MNRRLKTVATILVTVGLFSGGTWLGQAWMSGSPPPHHRGSLDGLGLTTAQAEALEEYRERAHERRQDYRERLEDLLTDEQREQMEPQRRREPDRRRPPGERPPERRRPHVELTADQEAGAQELRAQEQAESRADLEATLASLEPPLTDEQRTRVEEVLTRKRHL